MRFLLLPLFLLTSCWVQSIEPLCDPARESLEIDGLEGLWLGTEERSGEEPDVVFFEFTRHADRNGYRLTVHESAEAQAIVLEAHVFQVGDRLFLDTAFKDFADSSYGQDCPMLFMAHFIPAHLAWSLRRAGDGFEFALLRPDQAQAGLQGVADSRVPRREPRPGSYGDSLIFTGSSESVRNALATYPADQEWLRLHRAQAVRFPR